MTKFISVESFRICPLLFLPPLQEPGSCWNILGSVRLQHGTVTDTADLKSKCLKLSILHYLSEACIGVLGIQDICHFTSRDIGYYSFYFQGYGIIGSIFSLLPGILKI